MRASSRSAPIAPYRGRRSASWLKIKCIRRQEFVIVGWTPSDKSGRGFRSLLLGVHEDGTLRYAGKVGTGFDNAGIDRLMALMAPLAQDKPTVEAPRAAVRGAHWIAPKLVAEIAFTEVTDDFVLRHPSFLGLREDKAAADVIEEKVASVEKVVDEKPFGVNITNRESASSSPNPASPRASSPIITRPSARHHARLDGGPPDQPGALSAGPRQALLFPEARRRGSFGDHVKHVPIREKDGHDEPYLYVADEPGLLTCMQMGDPRVPRLGLEDRQRRAARPHGVLDLDPDEGLDFETVKAAAAQLRDVLGEMGLVTFRCSPAARASTSSCRSTRPPTGSASRISPTASRARDRRSAPRPVHRQHEEDRTHRAHLPRLAAQTSAARDRGDALIPSAPGPTRRSPRRLLGPSWPRPRRRRASPSGMRRNWSSARVSKELRDWGKADQAPARSLSARSARAGRRNTL